MSRSAVLLLCCAIGASAQLDAFALPNPNRYPSKPMVPAELRNFFELDGHARELMDSLIGPRPGGFFPEKTYDIGPATVAEQPAGPVHQVTNLERTLESFFTAPETPSGAPPGFGAGFALSNNNKALLNSNKDAEPEKFTVDEKKAGKKNKSSIGGIPMVFPKLPKAPVAAPAVPQITRRDPLPAAQSAFVPSILTQPEVPEGGFIPSGDVRRSPQSVSNALHAEDPIPEEEYGGLADETSTGSGGLIGTIINLIGLGSKKGGSQPENKEALGKAVSNLIGGENSPLPAKNVLSNVLYKALTAGTVQNNETDVTVIDEKTGAPKPKNLTLTAAQKSAIGEQLKMIQNLVIQPSSPLCTSKPEPVAFDFASFMGQWYQVLYSPPLSNGPCSMVSYKKLSDVNGGGPGSLFEIFEYTTDGIPQSKPKISSGYALVKAPGELIYRTNSNQEDVNVHVIHVGPVNANHEYEYVVLSTNCNYPLYVFARDPVYYKQRYEAEVSLVLEEKKLINGFSRLLNIVAPVDNTMCHFPPSVFNMQG